MKTVLSILVLISFASCKRENQVNTPAGKAELRGEWVRVLKSGGIAGIYLTPDSGYNVHYTFDDQKLVITENGRAHPPVGYSTLQKKSLLNGEKAEFLILNTSDCPACQLMPEYTFSFSPKSDSLFINEDVYDGFNYTYVKKRIDGWLAATYVGVDPRLCPSPCCGGYLLNIEGVTYTTTSFPANFSMDYSKKPQKLLVKIQPTPFSCAPIPVVISEAKLLP